MEFGTSIKVTIATPELIESEMTRGKYLAKDGEITVDHEIRDLRNLFHWKCDGLRNMSTVWYMCRVVINQAI